jgi:hypothetical protein
MVATAGMGEWDIDLSTEHDVVAIVLRRARAMSEYHRLRDQARPRIAAMKATTMSGLRRFSEQVIAREHRRQSAAP